MNCKKCRCSSELMDVLTFFSASNGNCNAICFKKNHSMVALRRMCFQVWVHRSGFDDEHWVPGYFPNGSRYWWVKCWRHWLKKRRRGAKGLVLRASVAQQIWTWGITCCVWQGMDRVFPRVFLISSYWHVWFLPEPHEKKDAHFEVFLTESFLQQCRPQDEGVSHIQKVFNKSYYRHIHSIAKETNLLATIQISWWHKVDTMIIPLVPHKAVAEVSKIGNL